MYKIKQIPEDFKVKELSDVKPDKEGKFTYFILKKRNYTTQRAVKHIADALNISDRKFGFAGIKDKNAVTEQLVSVNIGQQNLEKLKLKDIEVKVLGKGDKQLSLGDLKGNHFDIVVRNITKKPRKLSKMINYFDEQRFSNNNIEVGRALLKKEFKKAVELILQNKDDYKIKDYLEKSNNYVGALMLIPRTIIKLFIHSYQADVWNKTVDKFKSKKILPIVGFSTEFKDKKIESFVLGLLKKDNITQRDFIIKQLPHIISEGTERAVYVPIKNLKINKLEKDELNQGKNKCFISFNLPKGSYATAAIKQMFQ